MALSLSRLELGPWPMNAYLLKCEETNTTAIVDPGADADTVLEALEGCKVGAILITHGHEDHIGALGEIKAATKAPVYMHPVEADHFGLAFDLAAEHKHAVMIGSHPVTVYHTPGHTPGQVCYHLSNRRVLVGDTLFVNGPGKTWSADDFATTMWTLQQTIFEWPDETEFFPGHGPSGTIGEERARFDAFVAKGWDKELFGDVTWE